MRTGAVVALLVAAGLVLVGEHLRELRAWLYDRKLRRAMERREAVLPPTWKSENAVRLAGALNAQRRDRW